MSTPEGAIVRACLDYLHAVGITAWRNNTGAVNVVDVRGRDRFIRYGHVGSSDIIGYLPGGRALFVECKTMRGKLSPKQAEFLKAAEAAGCCAIVARSVDDLIYELGEALK